MKMVLNGTKQGIEENWGLKRTYGERTRAECADCVHSLAEVLSQLSLFFQVVVVLLVVSVNGLPAFNSVKQSN